MRLNVSLGSGIGAFLGGTIGALICFAGELFWEHTYPASLTEFCLGIAIGGGLGLFLALLSGAFSRPADDPLGCSRLMVMWGIVFALLFWRQHAPWRVLSSMLIISTCGAIGLHECGRRLLPRSAGESNKQRNPQHGL